MRGIYPRLARLMAALGEQPMTMSEIDEAFGTGRRRDTQAWVLALRHAGLIYIDHWVTHAEGGCKAGTPVYGCDFRLGSDCVKPAPERVRVKKVAG